MDPIYSPKPVEEPKIGDMIYYEEDVFTFASKADTQPVFAGKRISIIQVLRPGDPGQLICKIIRSAGYNADPIGAEIPKPIPNLKTGYLLQDMKFDNGSYKSGGQLEGEKDGKKVVLDNASQGGMSVGSKHTEGGIKGVVGSQQQPIEFEGEEIILTAPVSSNPDTYEFEGKKLTGREIASQINQDNGGVSFAEGGQPNCRCKHKEYKFGGSTMNDRDIINYINFMNKPINERIQHLNK
jgi:hypothetical protein